MSNGLIDPTVSAYALSGKIVTMDDELTIIEHGRVYVQNGRIAAVIKENAAVPDEFEDVPVIDTNGIIFPGLIELHNHLTYNILPMWHIPEKFVHRGRWRSHPEKRQLVTAPMRVLGKTPGYVPAIVRYVECKCLVSGVTSSQGISLYGVGTKAFYEGIVRNVESPVHPQLTRARTRIGDVKPDSVDRVRNQLEQLEGNGCYLLHLCEGVDDKTLGYFTVFKDENDDWGITNALSGIHSIPLKQEHYQAMADEGASMVWSPLSNLLLYGQTADVRAAKDAGVTISIGSDWSPSGSKNLLCELKVAHLISQSLAQGGQDLFTPAEIVTMATSNAAKILKWDQFVGSVGVNKLADLLVIAETEDDPYEALIKATETTVSLVIINGTPRYGTEVLMGEFAHEKLEGVNINGEQRQMALWEESADPRIRDLSLQQATTRLKGGLSQLVDLAQALESPADLHGTVVANLARNNQIFDSLNDALLDINMDPLMYGAAVAEQHSPPLFLHLELDDLDEEFNPLNTVRATVPDSELLQDVKINLDPLTIVDDENYFVSLFKQKNIDEFYREELPKYYGVDPLTLSEAIDFLSEEHEPVRAQFATTLTLKEFMNHKGYMTLYDRHRIVEQALVLLEQAYVHLPLKRAMHAIDPVQKLRLLQFQLQQQTDDDMPEEIEFHRQMLQIFTSLRDLHTAYILPYPYKGSVAFLPFLLEECFEDNRHGREPKYIVTYLMNDAIGKESFTKGVEITHWNGIPIERAVAINGEQHAGSNTAARHSRGLDTMTIRHLSHSLPPHEEWVTLHYCTEDGDEDDITLNWLVFSPTEQQNDLLWEANPVTAAVEGIDRLTTATQQAKKLLFFPTAVSAEREIKALLAAHDNDLQAVTANLPEAVKGLSTTMPGVFRAMCVPEDDPHYGYIRIFTFDVPDADAFVQEFVRLANTLPQAGLIIDVRDNGGGLIYAAEKLLQALTTETIEPERAQFINTPLTQQLCDLHPDSPLSGVLGLERWQESIRQSVRTGAIYSQGFHITPPEELEHSLEIGKKPIVLITDALCYSATDMFAAGFQDHGIGHILGVSANTGAGGANVWTHGLLQYVLSHSESVSASPLAPLPHGADMRVAIRRTMRVREKAGTPLEDLGITINDLDRHWLTENDLLRSNHDLIARACQYLKTEEVSDLAPVTA